MITNAVIGLAILVVVAYIVGSIALAFHIKREMDSKED